jgi:hypothetical protein
VSTRAAVEEHLAAFNAHDTTRLLAGFTADAVWITGEDTTTGQDALADLFDDWLWAMKPRLDMRSLLVDDTRAAAQLHETLTIEGAVCEFEISVFFEVADGLIRRAKVYRAGSADL